MLSLQFFSVKHTNRAQIKIKNTVRRETQLILTVKLKPILLI